MDRPPVLVSSSAATVLQVTMQRIQLLSCNYQPMKNLPLWITISKLLYWTPAEKFILDCTLIHPEIISEYLHVHCRCTYLMEWHHSASVYSVTSPKTRQEHHRGRETLNDSDNDSFSTDTSFRGIDTGRLLGLLFGLGLKCFLLSSLSFLWPLLSFSCKMKLHSNINMQ